MTVLDTIDTWFVEHVLAAGPFWIVLFTLSLISFIVVRYLRKHTDVLDREPPREEPPGEVDDDTRID